MKREDDRSPSEVFALECAGYMTDEAPVVDAGPIRRIPERIALCSAHGWWFPIDAFTEERCPEPGCRATIHYYMHRGLYTPEASS